jgi:hypothetical protein
MTFGEGLPFKSYEHDVLSRHKNVFEASLLFLKDHFEAISSDDLNAIQELRKRRNKIAHDLAAMLSTMNPADNRRALSQARDALFRLSNFWAYIDVGADPEVRALGVDWNEVAGEEFILLDRIIKQMDHIRTID